MLNQIRHMIGAAVACAVGVLPYDLLLAALSTPARVTNPRAPPHTLILSGSEFLPFKRNRDVRPTGYLSLVSQAV